MNKSKSSIVAFQGECNCDVFVVDRDPIEMRDGRLSKNERSVSRKSIATLKTDDFLLLFKSEVSGILTAKRNRWSSL